ncbi:MAG: hypothetical protein WC600_09800 [Desulfobaccales bacterium]
MPRYGFICETCQQPKTAYRTAKQGPPRFCCNICKVKGLSGRSLKPVRHVITPLMHEQIKRAYEGSTGKGQIRDLAQRLNLPRWKVTKYAQAQGLVAVQKKEPNWTEPELRILEQKAHCCPAVIRRHLKAAGYTRSEVGIVLKRKRQRFTQNLKGQPATTLALCFGVDTKTVTRWIEKGYLQTKKRGTLRTPQQGGDEWFIKDSNIKEFIVNYPNFVDFRKVDKEWLISLLTDGQMPTVSDSEGRGYEAAQY